MVDIEWNDSLLTGNFVIDSQHRRLVMIINRLGTDISADEYHMLLNALSAYAREHFEYEEQLFNKTPYPDKVAHHESHQRYCEFMAEAAFDSMGFITDRHRETLHAFLARCRVHHIQLDDMQYKPYLEAL